MYEKELCLALNIACHLSCEEQTDVEEFFVVSCGCDDLREGSLTWFDACRVT